MTTSTDAVRRFLRDYPETTKNAEAEARIVAIDDEKWSEFASTRSVDVINKFLEDNPETSKREVANARIQEIYNDLDWVQEQDTVEDYERFVSRFPGHPQREWIRKRIRKLIIDLEVERIAAGDHGEMPPVKPVSIGGAIAHVVVKNLTESTLTIRYSGPDSKKLIIPNGETRSVQLSPGDYQVAASVTLANVRNYYARETVVGGRYSSQFYVEQGFGGFRIR
ncbi:MAG: hypothetical protein R3F19_11865 [Verrucomicrobiales bacterium]